MNFFNRKSCLLLFLITSVFSFSQKLPFDNYTLSEGLPSNNVTDIKQDKKGYIWFATPLGVSRFDGYSFKNFNKDQGLLSNEILCIFPDSNYIWFGTKGGGISRYDGFSIKNYSHENGLINDNIKFIFRDNQKSIIAISDSGISRITGNSIENFSTKNGLPSNYILTYLVVNDNIWLGTDNGIAILSIENNHIVKKSIELQHKVILDIIKEKNSENIWIAAQEDGIFLYENEKFSQIKLPENYTVICLEQTDQNLLIGTYYQKGAFKLDFKSKRIIPIEGTSGYSITDINILKKDIVFYKTYKNGFFINLKDHLRYINSTNNLLSNEILCMTSDLEGNIWVGTTMGVSKLSNKPFEIFTKDNGLPNDQVFDVYAGADKDIWIGTIDGLSYLNENKITSFPLKNPYSPDVYCIYQDKNDALWLGTFVGLTKINKREISIYKDNIWNPGGQPGNWANGIAEDSKGNIWAAHSLGISKFDGKSFINYTDKDGLLPESANTLRIDKKDNIFICTNNGLSFFDGIKFTNFNTDEGLSSNKCFDICFENDSVLWLGTDNGIDRIVWNGSIKNIRHFNTSTGLSSNSISFIEMDHFNNLWIGHEKGINVLNTKTFEVKKYDQDDGFPKCETYNGAISIDADNNVWIGTDAGLVKYNPSLFYYTNQAPKLYIRNVSLYNDSTNILKFSSGIDSLTNLPKELVLPHNKNNLVFDYVGIHFANPKKNLYQYQLKGYDDNWSKLTTDTTTVPYQKVPAGHYTFIIRAISSDGFATEKPVEFSFTITPPFYLTPVAIVIEVVLFLALLLTIITLRERKLKQDKRVLELKVKERTIEIEKQRDFIETQNREIKDSIKYAKRIQAAVLPSDDAINSLLNDYFILFKPRDIVSGDFYWITGKDKKIIIIAADCTGHGVPGAFMSMLGVSLLNQIVTSYSNIPSSEILNLLRTNIKRTLSQTGRQDETKDGMDIVLCILDTEEMKAQFSGAYNPLWILRDNELIIYKGDKMPIGIYIGQEKSFTCNDIDLKKGDILYMFSDGYCDQFGGPDEKKFKSGALKELLLQIWTKPMKEQKEILEKTIENWQGELNQIDDIMILGIKVN